MSSVEEEELRELRGKYKLSSLKDQLKQNQISHSSAVVKIKRRDSTVRTRRLGDRLRALAEFGTMRGKPFLEAYRY